MTRLANVTFDSFFENVMFHEVAHGLGIKNTINGKGTVRTSLKERAGAAGRGEGGHSRSVHDPTAARPRRR